MWLLTVSMVFGRDRVSEMFQVPSSSRALRAGHMDRGTPAMSQYNPVANSMSLSGLASRVCGCNGQALVRRQGSPLTGYAGRWGRDGLTPACPQGSVETISCPSTNCRGLEYIYPSGFPCQGSADRPVRVTYPYSGTAIERSSNSCCRPESSRAGGPISPELAPANVADPVRPVAGPVAVVGLSWAVLGSSSSISSAVATGSSSTGVGGSW